MKKLTIFFFKKLAVVFYLIHEQLNKVLKNMDQFVFTDLTADQKKLVSKSGTLRDKHSDIKRCFILACGPSINKQDLKKLEGEFCISVSNFFVHPDFKTIKPKYHVFTSKEPNMTLENFAKWFMDYENYSCGSDVIVSVRDVDSVVKYKGLIKSKVHYYCSTSSMPSQLGYNFDFSKPIPLVQSVSHLAIYHAINIGIKEIYLLGFDHNAFINIGKFDHFYAEEKSQLHQSGYEEGLGVDLGTLGGSYKNLWDVYKQLKNYALKHNVKIINITPKSLLDVFPKESFENVLNLTII